MERRAGRIFSEADRTILAQPHFERRRRFERAFNELMALQREKDAVNRDQGRAGFQIREEEVLIGSILKLRRLGIMPDGFRVSLLESDDRSSLDVTVQRGRDFTLTYELRTESAQRPPELAEILSATIKSFRNKRS